MKKETPTWIFLVEGILGWLLVFLMAFTLEGYWGYFSLFPALMGYLGFSVFRLRLRNKKPLQLNHASEV